ncbi:MAG: helix-turn-helix transcriptional regulator, partial [Candidatus Nanopelagicales bacterium]|nr:helix-turn-helix transcriptional regulator [Candidatus Nanopelagicales bacterium]
WAVSGAQRSPPRPVLGRRQHRRACTAQGEHRRRTRRLRDAREPLTAALEVFEAVGAPPWAERARRELAAAGARVPAPQPAPGVELSPQETRVALAVADGCTNAEVADLLFLSVKTVEFHLSSVYRKLGVRSRGGLAKALVASHG